jgi:hypothetical protein
LRRPRIISHLIRPIPAGQAPPPEGPAQAANGHDREDGRRDGERRHEPDADPRSASPCWLAFAVVDRRGNRMPRTSMRGRISITVVAV